MDRERLIDRIYEAAAFADEWPSILHDLARMTDCAGAMLLVRRSDLWTGWRLSQGISQGADDYLRSPAAGQSMTTARLFAQRSAGFIPDHELFSEEEYLADTLMTQWGTPNGFHHGAATGILIPGGDLAVVQFQRRIGQPKVEGRALSDLNALRPHLARAAMLSARWRLQRLTAALDALEAVGLPAAAVSRDGTVLCANALMQRQEAHVVWLPRDRIGLRDEGADNLVRAALFKSQSGERAVCSVPIPATEIRDAAIVHVTPSPLQAQSLFEGGVALVVITPVKAGSPGATLLQGLFDLTPAEARVAGAIAEGLDIPGIAARQQSSRETVRSQIKAVFAKTGTRRQAELAALLAGVPQLRGGTD